MNTKHLYFYDCGIRIKFEEKNMKKFTLILFLFFSSFNFSNAQPVTIGTGTANTLYGPIYIYSSSSANTHSWNLSIYQQSELLANGGSAGTIGSAGWYKNDAGGYLANDASFEIYMKTTTLSDFSGGAGNFDIESVGADLVYSNTAVGLPASTGWVDFTFSTPFSWNGTDNIMILTRWVRNGAGTAAVNWAGTGGFTPPRVSHSFNTSTTMGSLYTTANRPNIRMDFTPLGITESNAAGQFELFPNPAEENVTVQLSKPAMKCRIEVLNAFGQSVYSENTDKQSYLLNLEAFAKGMYSVELKLLISLKQKSSV